MQSEYNAYWVIIFFSVIIIISFLFNRISEKTRIPSVLMLIALGIGFTALGLTDIYYNDLNLLPSLHIFGVIGLIMIVLEASLDLKLSTNKRALIVKAFLVAAIILFLTSIVIALIFSRFLNVGFNLALLYAIPMSVMSSAIIIPSIFHFEIESKREFMIYEATFSDILGIIFFYTQLDALLTNNLSQAVFNSLLNIGLTIIAAIIVTYATVFLFQKWFKKANFFMIFAILFLLYAIGKMLHLSSLIIILIFGVIVNNKKIFFRGTLERLIDPDTYSGILKNFKLFTGQTAFLVRTFFFVFFGMTVSLSAFSNYDTYIVTFLIIVSMFAIRLLNLALFFKTKVFPELFIAPRGLITILLFFAIPEKFLIESFERDIIFMVIIITNLIMTLALLLKKNNVDNQIT